MNQGSSRIQPLAWRQLAPTCGSLGSPMGKGWLGITTGDMTLFATLLAPDVAWLKLACADKTRVNMCLHTSIHIYVYKPLYRYIFIYIYTYKTHLP